MSAPSAQVQRAKGAPLRIRISAEAQPAAGADVVSREAAIVEHGVVCTGGLDDDALSYDAARTNAARASRPGLAGGLFDQGPGYLRLPRSASCAHVEVARS